MKATLTKAVSESEGRMMTALIELEGRLQASTTVAGDRLTDKFTVLENELGQELRKELNIAHMVMWNTMHESYKAQFQWWSDAGSCWRK